METETPLSESERVFYGLHTLDNPEKPSGMVRFIKQLYNSTVANTITAIRTKSEFGKLGVDLAEMGLLKEEFRSRVESGLPVTVERIDFYTEPYKKGSIGSMFGVDRPDWAIKIRKDYPMQARAVIHAIWGAGQMMFTKMIVVVDDHVDVHDEQDVLFHMGANVDWRRDTVIADGPCDILDHATPYYGTGAKIGIDAPRKISGEGVVREWPDELAVSDDVAKLVERRWTEYGL